MPKVKTKSALQKRNEDRARKRVLAVCNLVGDESTSLPDDVIQAALDLMKNNSDEPEKDFMGYYTPVELHLLSNSVQDIPKPFIDPFQFSVNIHHLPGHWVTSCQFPNLQKIHVYDSLMSRAHFEQVLPQIQVLYGRPALSKTIYKQVLTQQSTDPICGVMAIAFAFSCFLGQPCHSVKYDLSKARHHLRQCLLSHQIKVFPTCQEAAVSPPDRLQSYFTDQMCKDVAHKVNEQSRCASTNKDATRKREQRQDIHKKKNENEQRRVARSDPIKKQIEKNLKSSARKDPIRREKENERRRLSRRDPARKTLERNLKRCTREDPIRKEKENERRRLSRRDPARKTLERNLKRFTREDPIRKEKENERHRLSRRDPARKTLERNLKRFTREDPIRKEKENEWRRLSRRDPARKTLERNLKRFTREDPIRKEKENERRRLSRRDPARKTLERNLKRFTREDPIRKEKENEWRRLSRRDPARKTLERNLKRFTREDPIRKEKENEQKRLARADPARKEKENERRRFGREDPARMENETKLKKIAREDPIKKQKENQLRRSARVNPLKREKERRQKQIARENPTKKEKENSRRRLSRKDPELMQKENQQKKRVRETPQKCEKKKKHQEVRRANPQKRDNDNKLRKLRRKDSKVKGKRLKRCSKKITSAMLQEKFKKAVSFSCDYECTCCCQIFFRHSVVRLPNLNIPPLLHTQCISRTLSVDDKEWICYTCLKYLRKKKMPPLSKANKMGFPLKSDVLKLNNLEERLVSPYIIFLQMKELPSGGQVCVKGNVVNVPSDSISTVQKLPRRPQDSETVPVKLKRRLRYKTHYLYENVRPERCVEATRHLLSKPLFQKYVTDGLDTDWLNLNIVDQSSLSPSVSSICSTEKDSNPDTDKTLTNTKNMQNEEDMKASATDSESDAWSENDNDLHPFPGVTDTMMFPTFTCESDGQHVVSLARSEGNVPVSIFSEDVEELSFPTIFCGEKRHNNKERSVPVKYSDICKLELRHKDRRCSTNVTNLFFKTRKLQLKQIQDKVQFSVRRKQSRGTVYTAKDVRDKTVVEKMAKLDEGFRIFRTLRGSPPYWENAKRDIFAMLRQCNIPTWFISLSAAETHWKPLLRSLGKVIDHVEYTDEEINKFTWQTKSRLIKSDPVTVARYFDYRIQQFMSIYLLSPEAPLGTITDFWYRVEFQQRGSPHIHGLLWVDGSPKLDCDDLKQVENFVSQHISTDSSFDPLVSYQKHRHSHTCRKKGKKECRFNFPLPPMSSTKILEPLTSCESENEKDLDKAKKDWSDIATKLEKLCCDPDLSFEDLLQKLELSESEYIKAIRSSLKDTKVLLKRQPNAIRINGYNPGILCAWEANHDIQYVTDAYACAMYIVSYISKGQRGMSDLMRRACEDARKGSSDIRAQVQTIGNKFTKHVEISAQEASYISLQLPLRRSSRAFVFINTSPPQDRPFILKDEELLKKLSDDSEDIQCDNIISRYAKRSRKQEQLCLAEFAAWYTPSSNTKTHLKQKTPEDLPESGIEDNLDDDFTADSILVEKQSLRKRKKAKVIRFVNYNKKNDRENHFRERLLLYHPWRNESKLLCECSTFEEKYTLHKQDIEMKMEEYSPLAEKMEEVEEILFNAEIDECVVAPNTQHLEEKDKDGDMEAEADDAENLFTNYDVGGDIGCPPGTDNVEELVKNRLSDKQFRDSARSLNKKQSELFHHVLKTVKTSAIQFFIFITGGAGVGKTKLTKTLYQALVRYYNSGPGANPEETTVLLAAPTGKAAYLIGGSTIHSAFHIPANQSLTHKPLNNSSLNTLRTKLGAVKTIFIDEISMCGAKMFNFINLRLQEVTKSDKAFGGINIICIGDLFQLQPVMDKWIFQFPSSGLNVLAPNLWTNNIKMFELTEIMRQAGDRRFAEALNNIREGKHTAEDIDLLLPRIIGSEETANYPWNATHILYYNSAVQQHNTSLFDIATTLKLIHKSVDLVIGDVSDDLQQQILERAPVKAGDSMGLQKTYKTAVGLRNELTVNLDVQDGLVNGAAGTTKHVTFSNKNIAKVVWIEFDDMEIGNQLRRNSGHLYSPCVQKKWTPIIPVKRQFLVGRYKNAKLQREQFPLQMSCAKTVHRCQGDTLDEVVVQLPKENRPHVHYVALSRIRALKNLHILKPFDADKIRVSGEVSNEMHRLRTHCQLELCFTPLYTLPTDYFIICFQNAQSINLHMEDILANENFKRSDILLFCESKLSARETDVVIPMFSTHRNDFAQTRSPYGTIAFIKTDHKCTFLKFNKLEVEVVLLKVTYPKLLNVLCVYSRPKEKYKNLESALQTVFEYLDSGIKTILLGDFNTTDVTYKKLCSFMENWKFKQIVNEFTTDNRTMIDLIFINFDKPKSFGVLESYYSYHKPIWIAL